MFDRLCAKFRYRVDLWLEYLKVCMQMASRKNFHRVFSNALRYNARSIKLWLVGIYYEFEVNRNPFKSRQQFLRALKLNPNSSELWAEYFRFECKFVKLVESRQELITGESNENNKGLKAELEQEDEGFLAFEGENEEGTKI